VLFAEPLNPVREFGTLVTLVRELCDRESEWLQVPRDSQWPGIDGLKTDIANQLRHHAFRIVAIAAVEQARSSTRATLCLEDIEQDFARDRAEGRDELARFVFFANASAPDDVCAVTRAVSLAFIGIEQVISTFPEMSPACFNTSLTRNQWTARSSTSASAEASRGVPPTARRPA
jgi:hypothetical protein